MDYRACPIARDLGRCVPGRNTRVVIAKFVSFRGECLRDLHDTNQAYDSSELPITTFAFDLTEECSELLDPLTGCVSLWGTILNKVLPSGLTLSFF